MFRTARFSTVALFLGHCAAAQASPTCALLDDLAGVDMASQDFAMAQDGSSQDAAIANMAAGLGKIDGDKLDLNLNREGFDDIQSFMESRTSVVNLYREGETVLAQQTATGQSYTEIADNLSQFRLAMKCGRQVEKEATTSTLKSIGPIAENRRIMTSKLGMALEAKWLGLTVLGVAVLAVFGWYQWVAYRRRKMRRSKRYNCRVELKLLTETRRENVTMHDISRLGCKIAVSASVRKGEPVSLWMLGDWVPGKVMWGNAHYVGVEFGSAISEAELLAVISRRARKRWWRTGGAASAT